MTKMLDLKAGTRFGRLVITGERDRRGKDKVIYEKCICDCGNETWVYRRNLIRGLTTSCGCFKQEKYKRGTCYKHGMTGTPIYRKYSSAKERCENPKRSNYNKYGGKGIRFLWSSFDEFYADMGATYESHVKEFGRNNTTLDRIDSKGNYCKENCRWATWQEQADNRNRNICCKYKGKYYPSIASLLREYGIEYNRAKSKLNRGANIEDIIDLYYSGNKKEGEKK